MFIELTSYSDNLDGVWTRSDAVGRVAATDPFHMRDLIG